MNAWCPLMRLVNSTHMNTKIIDLLPDSIVFPRLPHWPVGPKGGESQTRNARTPSPIR